MTLLISVANPRFVILLADRRITADGKLVDDQYNKLTILCCQDARVAIAFTGLARAKQFDTSEWIMSYLDKIAPPNDWFDSIFEGMRSEIDDEFKRCKFTKYGLTILVTGFVHANSATTRVSQTISNVTESGEIGAEFRIVKESVGDGDGTAVVAGKTTAVSSRARNALKILADSLADPRNAVRKAVRTLHDAAESGSAMRTIGDYCNSAVIECLPDTPIVATYHVPRVDRVVHGPSIVITGAMSSYGVEMQGPNALTGPEIGKKAHCWCGSGLFFRYCHRKKFGSVYAKSTLFRAPMTWMQRCEFPDARPSGRIFVVKGGFE